MKKTHYFLVALVASFVLVAALSCFGFASQAPEGSADDQADVPAAIEPAEEIMLAGPTDPYTSDEACLSCHGGSYEANAANTSQYGIWNPHSSIHGGYNSCDNCHEVGQQVTRNWCSNCHSYNAVGSDYEEAHLFLE